MVKSNYTLKIKQIFFPDFFFIKFLMYLEKYLFQKKKTKILMKVIIIL